MGETDSFENDCEKIVEGGQLKKRDTEETDEDKEDKLDDEEDDGLDDEECGDGGFNCDDCDCDGFTGLLERGDAGRDG